MAFATWPWNQWLDDLKAGNADPFCEGLKRAVLTYRRIRGKKMAQIREQYGIDSYDDLTNGLCELVLADRKIMEARAAMLGDYEIGQRINRTLENWLIDRWRSRISRKEPFIEDIFYSPGKLSDAENALESYLVNRLHRMAESAEDEAVLKDLLEDFVQKLTARQQRIFVQYEEFGVGRVTLTNLINALGIQKSTLYKEIQEIQKKRNETFKDGRVEEVGEETIAKPKFE